jgi:hypothetical protein
MLARVLLLLMYGLAALDVAVAQTFDRLTACAEMADVRRAADVDQSNCREPRTDLGRAMAERNGTQLCFFDARWTILRSFECVQAPGYPSIDCFRAVRGDPVGRVKARFGGEYDRVIAGYLQAAAACPYTNGRASPAPSNMLMASPVAWVARSELAFGAETGSPPRDGGAVLHGFASVDPDLRGVSGWLEYVRAYSGRCRSDTCKEYVPGSSGANNGTEVDRAAGLVLLREDPDPDLVALNRQALRSGVPIRWYAETFRVALSTAEVASLSDLKSLEKDVRNGPARRDDAVRRVARRLGRLALADGFRSAGSAELAAMGVHLDAMRKRLRSRIPYGSRRAMGPFAFEAYLKDANTGCVRDGAMFLAVFTNEDAVTAMAAGVLGCRYRARSRLGDLTSGLSLSAR